MATFFDTKYAGRPCLLWAVWLLSILSIFLLLLGMLIDDLTVATLSVGPIEYTVTCSSGTISRDPGPPNIPYSDLGFAETTLQAQAGSVWLAFGIMACLFIPFLLIGVVLDFFSGQFDAAKPIHYFSGCCLLQQWGFQRISVLFMTLLEFLQIVIYSASERCSTEEFFDEFFAGAGTSDLSSIGGASLAFVVMSFLALIAILALTLYYQYCISAELPFGEPREWCLSRRTERKAKEEASKPPPVVHVPAPSGEAPKSEYFQPKRNITGTPSPRTKSKPGGPPPVPQPKPKGPPPVPRKQNK